MSKESSKLGVIFAMAAASLGAPGVAAAQAPAPATDPSVEQFDLIVTAQRRAERLQDLPLSVSAFSGDMLEKMSVERVGDALGFVPNVALTAGPSGGDDANIFIRGVGQVDNSIAVDPGVGVYIDEVYIGRLQASSLDLLDIARVEVLRGPQGTLFGRNTIGGAVSVVTRDPGQDFEGSLRLVAGSRDRFDARATISGGLTETLAASVSVSSRNQRGWGENILNGATYGDVQDIGGRVKLVWEPTSNLKAKLAIDYTKSDGSPSSQVQLAATGLQFAPPPAPALQRSPLQVPWPAGFATLDINRGDVERNSASAPPIQESENMGAVATVEWTHSWGVIKSITAARGYNEFAWNDFDGTRFAVYDQNFKINQQQYSQELQAFGDAMDDRLNWLIGLYGFRENITNRINLCVGTNLPAGNPNCLVSENFNGLDVTSYAAFGQVRYSLTDKLKAIVGMRYTEEEKVQTFQSAWFRGVGVTLLPFPAPPPTFSVPNPLATIPEGTRRTVLPYSEVDESFESFTPKVGLEYKATDDVLVYLTYSEGFKSGGFTGRPSNANIDAYDPETVQSYELGWKSDLFDRRLRVNGAIFTSDYQDIQLLFQNSAGQFNTINAGDATISGAELEVLLRPTSAFTVTANAGYLDASYDRVASVLAPNVTTRDKLPLTPEWTYSVGASYLFDLAESGEIELRADWQWRDEVFFQIENDPLEKQEAYGLLNLRASYTAPGGMGVALYGTNVTDEVYLTGANQGNGVAFGGFGAPAEYGVELSLRF